jgi:hypothetical protein
MDNSQPQNENLEAPAFEEGASSPDISDISSVRDISNTPDNELVVISFCWRWFNEGRWHVAESKETFRRNPYFNYKLPVVVSTYSGEIIFQVVPASVQPDVNFEYYAYSIPVGEIIYDGWFEDFFGLVSPPAEFLILQLSLAIKTVKRLQPRTVDKQIPNMI